MDSSFSKWLTPCSALADLNDGFDESTMEYATVSFGQGLTGTFGHFKEAFHFAPVEIMAGASPRPPR